MDPTRSEFLFMDTPLTKAVFYVGTAISLAIMAWQFFGSARYWRRGKKITWKPDYLSGILTFVLGQRKVMGSRPKEGAPLHLLIFYGFLALFLATTLLAMAGYAPLIGIPNWHRGTYYLIYEFTFDALGLLFVAGVIWALVRRYRIARESTPPMPDPATGKLNRSATTITSEWHDFAILYLLLILGVSGYVLEAARIAADPKPWDGYSFVGYSIAQLMPGLEPQGYRLIWWQHVVWVWLFFATIPQMRIKHIWNATFTAAGRPDAPMGQLPVVEEEQIAAGEQVGAAFARDYSRWHLMSLDACMSCGRCTEVCPAYNVGKVLDPKQVVQDTRRALRTGEPVAAAVSEEALWQCTTCNACVEACPVLIRHVDIIVDARRNLVGEGQLTGTATAPLRQIAGTGSAWGQAQSEREAWMEGLEIPLARESSQFDILFWVGCAGATDPGAIRATKAFASLLKKAGVNFACLGAEEVCTGDPARRIGDEATFQNQASQIVQMLLKYKVTRVVTACPHCMNTLQNEYPDYGLENVEVLHHTQLLADLIAQGRLKTATPAQGSVTYHDPCYLARINNISDAPRALLDEETDYDSNTPLLLRVIGNDLPETRRIAEPKHHAKKTLCCGAGGGRMWMEEEPDQRPANRRVEELLATGADTIAVACPFCRIMLDAGIGQTADSNVNLVDLAELLNEANP